MTLTTAPLYLVEITAYDPFTGSTRVLRYASGTGFTTKPSESPSNTYYDGRIAQPIDISRTMFSAGGTMGRSTVGVGDLILSNDDGALDDLVTYGFDGQSVIVRRTTVLNPSYPSDFTSFTLTATGAEFSSSDIRLHLRDRQQLVNVPFQATKYAGSNSLPNGLEGTAEDLKGKPKPVCYGVVYNVPAPQVNTSKLIHQVNDGALASVDAVYDRGVVLAAGTPYSSLADLQDDAQAPSPGTYRAYLAGGYIRLGATPDGQVTVDATQGANAAARTAAQLFKAGLARAGLTSSSTDYKTTDLTALDSADSSVLGFWTMDETTVADFLDQVAGTPGAAWWVDANGVFRIAQFVAPSGTPVATFTQNDYVRLERITPADEGKGIPVGRVTLRHSRNYTVQNVDFLETATYATTAPSNPATDDLWVDTSVTPNIWNRWSGSAWVKITPTSADEIEETASLKWAAEHGAEVTTGKSLTVLADRTADHITYTAGGSVDSLKPAEAGAEATAGKSITVLVDRTADHISYTAGGSVDSLKPAEAGAETTTGKPLDVLIDGSTYARTKATELSSGQVKQTVDTVESTTLTTNQARRESIMYGVVL